METKISITKKSMVDSFYIKREKKRIVDKIYQKEKRKRIKGYKTVEFRKWRERNPEAYLAQNKVKYALRIGKIIKNKCEVCNRIDTHGHHDDYSKPLDVRWLCPIHHKLQHNKKTNNEKRNK